MSLPSPCLARSHPSTSLNQKGSPTNIFFNQKQNLPVPSVPSAKDHSMPQVFENKNKKPPTFH